ncbi:Dinitrogenase iron-molybdenum cofactor [Limihaloglobus sulfuriphilus]|uniref:Dinitrogenase iron-molybdenum cofactor n=1 Tax=Limihaloglobus sulfuriphilus TaxID=1851148 RepID=A0A1Q2MC97_9BACT|nr:NifB/NifX family molybdenum-iron cluster-binding protein [Limihaloglobus sulfuriphilus]AQQ70311.1 Dinitrogenase iron-molybdenum cofactor [Limihaloglobus sulfuriphilus]
MKIAVCLNEKSEKSEVSTRFGRAEFFGIYNDADKSWKFIENSQNLQAPQGAGLQSAQYILDAGSHALIAANVGPKAMRVMQNEGIDVFLVSGGITAEEAVEKCLKNELKKITEANVEGHWV